jgi:hypothetical protein
VQAWVRVSNRLALARRPRLRRRCQEAIPRKLLPE